MTDQYQPFAHSDDDRVPAVPDLIDAQQPIAAVREAYWYGTRLLHHGWLIRQIGASERGGFFAGVTPRGRAVTVGPDHRCDVSDDLAAQFADALTVLAGAGFADGHDYLRDLVILLGANAVPRRPSYRAWRTWRIPGVPASQQPHTRVRAAYWFAVTSTDDYGWQLSEFGASTAGGGFLADIPGEAMAIYPASMPDDGTTAAALARLVAVMNAAEIATLASLVDWHGAARTYGRGERSFG